MCNTDWIRQWFSTNQVVVFGMYGQVFFTLGVALAVQSMKHTRLELGRHLHWLATFGLSHGLVEWGYVFIPIQEAYLPPQAVEGLRWIQLLLMAFSFVALMQFGLRTCLKQTPFGRGVGSWASAAIVITMALALSTQVEATPQAYRVSLEIWTRYVVAVPGALLSAIGIFKTVAEARSMQVPRIAHWLRISAWSLASYALLNLITPQHHGFLSSWINYDSVLSLLGVPAQIWRTLVGAGMLYGMIRSLALFDHETDRLLQEAHHERLLEAQRELSYMNQIAITLGKARDPGSALRSVLDQFLPLLRCTGGLIAVQDQETVPVWRTVARVGHCPPEWEPGPDPLLEEVARKDRLILREIAPTCHGVGIPIRGGHSVLAVAALFRRDPVEMSPEEVQVVESIGTLVGVSLENTRLWTELHTREADRTQWISRIISAQEDERRRIAHELHDDSIQTLVLLCRRLDQVEDSVDRLPESARTGIGEARGQVEELIASLRKFAHDLRPPALDNLGVASSIQRLLLDLASRAGVRWELEVEEGNHRLGHDVEIGLFRIAQEAIRNVEHHARARSVRVEFRVGQEHVRLSVADDGQGMSPRVWQGGSAASGRLGLVGMQERASLLGGELIIDSRPGGGARVTVTVPLKCPRVGPEQVRLELSVDA